METTDGYAPVGAIVFSHERQHHYTVLSHNADGSATILVLGDGSRRGRGTERITHREPMHPRDQIVGIRERLSLYSRDHRARLAQRLAATAQD